MQALLLATGETQRLKPLTERIPSPMVPLINRPIMVYNLELLGRLGFKEILVSVHAYASSIETYFGNGQKWGLALEYILQREALGSAGSLRRAKQLLHQSFVVMPADQVADLEIAVAIRQHVAHRAAATVVAQPGSLQPHRLLQVDSLGYVQAINSGKPGTQPWIDTGIYVFDPLVLEWIPSRKPFDTHEQLLPILLARGIPIQTCVLPGYWNPLDTLQEYAEAQHVFLSKALKEMPSCDEKITYRYNSLETRQISHGIWTGRNVRIHPDARISPMVYIGNNSWIGRETELGPAAVIGENVVIDQGATIQQSIILDNTYVGKLVHIQNRLVDQEQVSDMNTNENIRVTDPNLLGKTDPLTVTAGLKRPLELCLAVLLFTASFPLMLTLGALLLVTTGRVFTQIPCFSMRSFRRNGHTAHAQTFSLLHFNTHRKDGSPHWLGSWLERWEGQRLLELWNVLKGDLALIGLKPVITEAESRLRTGWELELERVPAGLTGLWYIQRCEDTSLEETLIADVYYLATRSWNQDWKILWRTPSAWYRRTRSKAETQPEVGG